MTRRRRLESKANRRRAKPDSPAKPPEGPPAPAGIEAQRLLHELRVHQIELELQNAELQESRARLELASISSTELYDFAPVAYFTLGRDGLITRTNLAGAALLGLERAQVVGRRLGGFVRETDLPKFDGFLRAAFAPGPRTPIELQVIGPAGTTQVVRIDYDLSADRQQCRAVLTNITEVKRLTAEREALQSELAQLQKTHAVGQLAGGIAHELNNILAAIMLQLGLLERSPELAPGTRAGLKEVGDSAEHAATVIRQLLVFSRRTAFQARPVDILAVVTKVLRLVRRLLGEKIEIVLAVGGPLPSVVADSPLLEQAVMNLLLNARDAMPGGGQITISATTERVLESAAEPGSAKRAGKFVCLSIADEGCGISPRDLPRIFEPFFTTKAIGKGTGLGLAIVHGIVQQHQGWVEVKSVPNEGSTFLIHLPASETADAAPELDPASVADRCRGTEGILLVEDDDALRVTLRKILEMLGYRIVEARDGMEALQIRDDDLSQVDLLFTDMVMPGGLSGLDLAKALQVRKPQLRVLISSGYHPETLEPAEIGFPFIPKPYSVSTLARGLRACLDRPGSEEPAVSADPGQESDR